AALESVLAHLSRDAAAPLHDVGRERACRCADHRDRALRLTSGVKECAERDRAEQYPCTQHRCCEQQAAAIAACIGCHDETCLRVSVVRDRTPPARTTFALSRAAAPPSPKRPAGS